MPKGGDRAAQLSRVRNAARDMANAYLAFEKAWARLSAASSGLPNHDVVLAVNDGCDSPERRKAFMSIHSKIVAANEPPSSPTSA